MSCVFSSYWVVIVDMCFKNSPLNSKYLIFLNSNPSFSMWVTTVLALGNFLPFMDWSTPSQRFEGTTLQFSRAHSFILYPKTSFSLVLYLVNARFTRLSKLWSLCFISVRPTGSVGLPSFIVVWKVPPRRKLEKL